MTRKPLVAAFVLLVCGSPARSNAVNLLPNGDFSARSGADGWRIPFSPAPASWVFEWSSDDAQGDAASGALQLDPLAGEMVLVQSACFRVVPGAAYTFGGQGRRTSGAADTWLTCTLFSDTACKTGGTDSGSTQIGTGPDWADGSAISGNLPPAANSMHCRVIAYNEGHLDAAAVQVDNLYFVSSDKLFASGFEPLASP